MGHFVKSRLPKFVPYFIKISLPWRWRPTNKMRNRIVEKNINRHYNKITKTKIREKRGGRGGKDFAIPRFEKVFLQFLLL